MLDVGMIVGSGQAFLQEHQPLDMSTFTHSTIFSLKQSMLYGLWYL